MVIAFGKAESRIESALATFYARSDLWLANRGMRGALEVQVDIGWHTDNARRAYMPEIHHFTESHMTTWSHLPNLGILDTAILPGAC